MKNRQWVLASRPIQNLQLDNFRLQKMELNEDLDEVEILVKNTLFRFAPTLRNWMNEEGKSYLASIKLGEPIRSPAVFEVIKSNNPA